MLSEVIWARGHGNISARHKTTLMFTRDDYVTPQGDCIVAVDADRCMGDFPEEFREKLIDQKTRIEIMIRCSGACERVVAWGHPSLSFKNPRDMVVRKSSFICDRTLAIGADKAAVDLDRRLIDELREGKEVGIEIKIH